MVISSECHGPCSAVIGVARFRMEGDALHVAVAVGVSPLVEALGRIVVGMRVAVRVDTEHLGSHHRRALRHLAVVGVARRQPQGAIGTEPHAAAVMRAGAAERVVRRGHLVGDVIDDVGPVGNAGEVLVDREPHQAVRVRGRHVRGGIDVDARLFAKSGSNATPIMPA
jgi:hypothetical protein